jgi:UDP-glucose 4-epimerase
MKVLITGASGKVGRFVIREVATAHDVVLMSRSQPDSEFSRLSWIQGDLNSFADCEQAVQGVEAIQHIGAQPWPTDHPSLRAEAERKGLPFDATFKTNMLGTYYLLQAAVAAGSKIFVMAGSNCALGHGFRLSKAPFPLQALPIDETHPCYPEDSYSYTKRAAEDLLATATRAFGIRTYVTRISGVCPPERRQAMAREARPTAGWDPWMWCWVGAEDVGRAHRLIMEAGAELPPHDVYYLNADDTSAFEPSLDLVDRFRPDLRPLVTDLEGHASLFSNKKLQRAVGWRHETSWRDLAGEGSAQD